MPASGCIDRRYWCSAIRRCTQFIASNPNAGLDWPVRLLVTQDNSGAVWTVYSDFAWIAARHGITNRAEQFKMASMVIASITSSVKAR
jgi:uncharacterized protein (DUF302 family)